MHFVATGNAELLSVAGGLLLLPARQQSGTNWAEELRETCLSTDQCCQEWLCPE